MLSGIAGTVKFCSSAGVVNSSLVQIDFYQENGKLLEHSPEKV